jgi:hypothetical protein
MLAAAHDHFEYATLIAGLAVALGTFAAAGVALFGPAWSRRRRQPALGIELDGLDEAIVLKRDPSVQRVTLRLDNAEGRDRAEEVEVYVDVGWEFEPSAMLPLAEQELLPFGDPRDPSPPPTSKHVAPGFSRWLPLLLLGDAATLARDCGLDPDIDSMPDGCVGAVAIARLKRERAWLIADQEYFVTITATGANFDAVACSGRFILEVSDMEFSDVGDLRSIEVRWTQPLKIVKRRDAPTRLAAAP